MRACVCLCVHTLRHLASALILCIDACISVRECASACISACEWMSDNL